MIYIHKKQDCVDPSIKQMAKITYDIWHPLIMSTQLLIYISHHIFIYIEQRERRAISCSRDSLARTFLNQTDV